MTSQPERPPGLDEFEADIMPAVGTRTFDRSFLRALMRYVRRLERYVEEMGSFK